MKKRAVAWLRLHLREGPYPNSPLLLLLAFLAGIYALCPLPSEPFFKLVTHLWFLYSFTALFTIANGQIIIINLICKRLDIKYDWETQFWLRLVWQLLLGLPLPVIASLLVSWLFFPFDQHSARYAYTGYMLKEILNMAVNFNGLYLFCNFYYHHQNKPVKEIAITEIERQPSYADYLYLRISDEKEELRVRVSDIAYIYRTETGPLVLRRHDASSVIFWESLNAVQKLLDPEIFCRASRNFIITRDAVDRTRKHPDRGMTLELIPPCDEIAKVSKDAKKEVEAWIKNEVRSLTDDETKS
ncbi:LytTr DNA-binding domain-containing protein [Mucilaginibacter gracilis]|uniref:LytTr DNA-binding domain-containing protein n=1 Tax=Mucilaginibacter gracilis TaxID=423350 RepID=A0A495J3W9_9SPHI|nr:LytTR family transcriptional regulator DNA-binding domain-containing protein [Mucilaginibacter gracilis]RKR83523.1 LytTr DNA-binding domain-containing protein [Mucilaginibacter gracilis]